VRISGDTTVRDVVTTKYDFFGRIVKRNGTCVVPFTMRITEGDTVTVEELQYRD
jgi:hypothetical protein